METGRVAMVRPVVVELLAAARADGTGAATPGAVVLLAATRANGTGAAAPDGAVGEATGALLAAACAGCTGVVAPVRGELGDRVPGLGGAGVDWDAATGACTGTGPCMAGDVGGAGVPACTTRTPGSGAVRSCSSTRKSKAEEAMGVVDMSAKGKKDSSKTTCRERIMRFDWSSRHR